MMQKAFILFLFSLVSFFGKSQGAFESAAFPPIQSGGKVQPSDIKSDWKPGLQSLEAPIPGSGSYRAFLMEEKARIKARYPVTVGAGFATAYRQAEADTPIIHRNFEGNLFETGVPNDNDIAISNDGWLVSVINSNIYIFQVDEDSLYSTLSLDAFASPLGLPAHKYDPKVEYDPSADRFVLVFLSGSSSIATDIVVGFSETSNPNDAWNVYAIPGNPLSDTTWTDYPILALTEDELFITVNLLRDNQSWQLGFSQSIIWQVDKNSGYSGQPLTSKLYTGIGWGGRPIRNLCPIQGGSRLYGPDVYLLSNRNFADESDTFFVLHITGKQDDLNTTLSIDMVKSDQPYGLSPDAVQPANQFLQTNDSRVLGGFYENGKIHFTGNSRNLQTGKPGIYHGIVTGLDATYSISGQILSDTLLEFGYPNISYTGKYPGDEEAIITFNHTAQTVPPGVSAIFFEGRNFEYSPRITVKEGETHVNLLSGAYERWGDYSGSQPKYDDPGKVWIAGFWGAQRRVGGLLRFVNCTWIAELASPDTTIFSSDSPQKPITKTAAGKLYPNPVSETFFVEFELARSQQISIELFSTDGRLVKQLLADRAKEGLNRFSFSTLPLETGLYLLRISGEAGEILTRRVVVQR